MSAITSLTLPKPMRRGFKRDGFLPFHWQPDFSLRQKYFIPFFPKRQTDYAAS